MSLASPSPAAQVPTWTSRSGQSDADLLVTLYLSGSAKWPARTLGLNIGLDDKGAFDIARRLEARGVIGAEWGESWDSETEHGSTPTLMWITEKGVQELAATPAGEVILRSTPREANTYRSTTTESKRQDHTPYSSDLRITSANDDLQTPRGYLKSHPMFSHRHGYGLWGVLLVESFYEGAHPVALVAETLGLTIRQLKMKIRQWAASGRTLATLMTGDRVYLNIPGPSCLSDLDALLDPDQLRKIEKRQRLTHEECQAYALNKADRFAKWSLDKEYQRLVDVGRPFKFIPPGLMPALADSSTGLLACSSPPALSTSPRGVPRRTSEALPVEQPPARWEGFPLTCATFGDTCI